MSFNRFYSQVSVVLKFSMDIEIDVPSENINDVNYISEKIQETAEELLIQELKADYTDDINIVIESIK